MIPTSRALFPYYATLLTEPARFAEVYLRVLSAIAVVGLSTGVGVSLVAGDLAALVLGPKWLGVAPLMGWLAIGSGVLGVTRSATAVLTVTGSGGLYAIRNWCFVAVLLPAAIVGGMGWGVEGIAAARMAAVILFVPVMFYTAMRVIPITAGQIVGRVWRPTIAAICMAAVVKLSGTDAIMDVPVLLLCNVGLGAATFAVSLLALWVLSGCSPGIERTVVEQCSWLWQRLLGQKKILPD